jgi:hypothetical protein
MTFTWALILYIHTTGTVLNIADYGPDKPDCDKMAASFNAGHDTGIQTFTCVPHAMPAPSAPIPARKVPRTLPRIDMPSFLLGVAAGEGLPE